MVPPWEVFFEPKAEEDLEDVDSFDGRRILDAIETQLTRQPNVQTRNRKPLEDVDPPFPHEQPVWELRVGAWRVIYSFRENERTVRIWSVFHKGRKTTEEAIKK